MKVYSFGKLSDGRTAGLYILKNANGMEVSITDYGATIVSLVVPDKNGKYRDVVLGHDDVSGYENGHGSIGAVVGRFANRICGAKVEIGGKTYELTANHGPNTLHGGRDFYNKRLWEAKIQFGQIKSNEIYKVSALESLNDRWPSSVQENITGDSVTFCLDSPDGDQGFPGNLHIEVTYTLTENDELNIDYRAVSDSDTPLNLTNHSYFNLNGDSCPTVLDQICQIRADGFTPNDEFCLPTGEIRSVGGTPFDFREPKPLGQDINEDDIQLKFGGGYDHNFVIATRDELAQFDETGGKLSFKEAASLYAADSGIKMTVMTDLPGVQLYTANGMNDHTGKRGASYGPRGSVCFETQFWPDAVTKENFPGGILRAGEEFVSRTTYKFEY